MGRRILIVDALPTRRIVMKAKLSAAHYDVVMACDLTEARAKLTASPCDVVFMDAGLEGMGGKTVFSFCSAIKTNPLTRSVPVIMTTDTGDDAQIMAAFRAGFDEVIRRPVGERVLLAQLRAVMRRCTADGGGRQDQLVLDELSSTGDEDPARPARIAVIARTRSRAQDCADAMKAASGAPMALNVRDFGSVLLSGEDASGAAIDAIVLMVAAGEEEAALTQLSDLRSSAVGTGAGLIMTLEQDRSIFAARAFDLGADNVVSSDISATELAIRARKQARFKQGQDARRQSLHNGLRLAVTDPLTGLYNRRYATRKLAQIAGAGDAYGLLMLDLDHFKKINDLHGHAAGDDVLTHISDALSANLRDSDLLARIGGEEFLVALPGATRAQAVATAERLRKIIDRTRIPMSKGGAALRVTMSIGLFHSDGAAIEVDELLARADTALYRSKAHGRNRVSVSQAA